MIDIDSYDSLISGIPGIPDISEDFWGFLGDFWDAMRKSKAVYAAWLECTCEVPGARQAQKSGGDLVIGNIRVKA